MERKHVDPPEREALDAFNRAASEEDVGILREFMGLLAQNKKWWLVPLLVVLLLVGLLVVLGSTALGPLLYPLF